ncbi:CBM35 domain-containing protein [Streptomyces sp. NPDC048057]|uniref:CBM35 domain-containing protein n=1 Tax=Streptomyces sp. NPDC048057 TaxID=3155628 RepID=UPI0033FA2636
MTAANNGGNTPNGSTPEDDDPFGYLYEDGQAAGANRPGQGRGYGYPGPATQPGVPRTSYNHVRAVGERQYGGHTQGGQRHGYGYPPPQQGQFPQQGYGQPTAQYAAPETYPGGAPARPGPPQGAGTNGGGRGPNTKALLIGAIAVVAVVVIGISVALLTKDDDKADKAADDRPTASAGTGDTVKPSGEPDEKPKDDKPKNEALPKQDAVTLKLGGSASAGTDIKGAEGAGGAFVTGLNEVGASVTWKAQVETPGEYRLYVRYTIPAQDANATLTINGKANSNPIGLKNFIKSSDPALEKNWQTTWAPVTLKQGANEIKISCETGNQCNAILDWLEVRKP